MSSPTNIDILVYPYQFVPGNKESTLTVYDQSNTTDNSNVTYESFPRSPADTKGVKKKPKQSTKSSKHGSSSKGDLEESTM